MTVGLNMCSLRWPCTRYNSTGTAAVCRVRTSDQDRPSTFTWSYRRLPSPTPSPPHKSQAKAKPGPLSVPSDSLPPLSSSSPTHPAIPLPPSTRGVEALGSRQQAARRSHPPRTKPTSTTSSHILFLASPCAPLFVPKRARADASKNPRAPRGSSSRAARLPSRSYSKQQRPSRREPPPPTHLLPPVVSAWLFVEQLVGT